MKITCPHCQKIYTINKAKIPPGTKAAKCKACGHSMPLKKEASAPPAEKPAIRLAVQPSQQPDILTITCANCSKNYRIRSEKIPPTAKAIKCKACGHRIPLPKTTVLPLKHAPAPSDATPAVRRPRKKIGRYAIAVGIILVVMIGAFTGFMFYKDRERPQFAPASDKQKTAFSALLEAGPFLALNLNVPLILDNLHQRIEKDKKTLKFGTTMALVKSLKLKDLELYLYADRKNQILPVILAGGSNAKHLENLFTRQEPFNKYFERKSFGKFYFKKETTDKYNFPGEPYQMTLLDKSVVFAPVSFSRAIAANKSLLLNTAIARFAKSISDPKDLARVAVRVPANLQKGWEKKIQKNPVLEKNPQVAIIAGMGAGVLSQLTDSLKSVEILALGFRFAGKNGRRLSYAQRFRTGVDGKAVYQKLKSDDLQAVKVDGGIRALIKLFQDRRYKPKLQFADNRLALEFSWLKKDDPIFLAALSKATFGQLMAQSMELAPTAGPVAAEYADDPHLFTTVDDKALKPKIPRIVKQSLFPGPYLNFGDKPRMTLDLDPVNIPNAALAELTYEVRSIQSSDGKDILRAKESQIKPTINPGRAFPGSISLSVKNGTPPESLKTARIQFMLSLPVALQIFEFNSGDKKGRLKKSGGIQITLGRLEKDIADVTYAGGKSVRLIAYDKTGKALASRETISASSSVSTRFQGIIDRLKVVVAASMLECPFEIEVDLNGGQELRLSRKPEIPERIRYNHHPVPTYSDFSNQDLENLAVTWRDAGEREWTDNLEIQLSKGPFSGQADWEIHFFGHDQPQFLTGNANQGARVINYRLEKGQLANVSAVFGIVQLKIRTNIKRLSFAKKEGDKPQTRDLSSGEPVTVSFNKNEVSYSRGKAQIIQVMAYDSFGKQLKQGNRSSSKGGKRKIYFWGQPALFEMDLSTQTLKKKIKFDIQQRPLDEKIYQQFKSTIDNRRDIVTTLKSVDRVRRKDRSYYGDDLAGLYYLYSPKSNKPMMLFDKVIAHSDPAGQKRFGYKAEPYKGYYFTVLSGAEANGVNKEYKRRSKKAKFVWEKGSVNTAALTRHPDLVAIPQDKSQPTFILQWGQVFMKPIGSETLKYLPEDYYKKGWVEAKFIEN